MIEMEKRGAREQDPKPEAVSISCLKTSRRSRSAAQASPVVGGQRAESGWAISKPNPTIEANQVVWDRAAKAVAMLDNARTIEPAADAAAYGLDKPVLTFTASRQEGAPLRSSSARLEPTQAYRYARLDGELVFLVDIEQFNELDRSLDLLRDRRLLKVGDRALPKFEFSRFRAPKNAARPIPLSRPSCKSRSW